MKKMTIALFTAAAMGTSGMVAAQTSPDFFGRVDVRVSDSDDNNVDITQPTSKFGFTDSVTDLAGGLDASYYVRVALDDEDNAVDYSFVTLGNDQMGTFTAGKNDDLVYLYAGVYTDIYRGQAQGMYANSSAYGAYSTDVSGNEQLQYTVSVAPGLELGAAIDTNANGVNRQQVGVSGSFGIASFGAVYSDVDETYDSTPASVDDGDEVFVGGSIDAGIASLRGTYADRNTDLKQYALSAIVPLTDVFTATVGYEDADNDITGIQGMVMADLGQGLDLNVGFESGDRDDLVIGGIRYTF